MLTSKTVVIRYMISKKYYLCIIKNQKNDVNKYEGLASYFLPSVVLGHFDVTDFVKERTRDKNVFYATENLLSK